MENNITNIKFTFKKRNEESWILEHSNKYFIVNDAVKILIELFKKNNYDQNKTYEDFVLEFEEISKKEFEEILQTNLKNLELDAESDSKNEKSFILFERKLVNSVTAGNISKFLQPIFQPIFFWLLFICLFVFAIYNLTTMHHFHLNSNYIIVMVLFYFLSAFIHEFGHIAACNKFTNKNGEIGVGIYFIFPVFYSNITPIWEASKHQRIITNLAGVYIQLILILFLYIGNYFLKIHEIEDIITLTTITIIYQLIPFIRTDGYWILSDLTDSPNLLTNSTKKVNQLIKDPSIVKNYNKRDNLELLYGIFNYIVMIYLILKILTNYKFKLIQIPFDLIKTVFTQPYNTLEFLNHNIEPLFISLIFYIISFNFINKIFNKNN